MGRYGSSIPIIAILVLASFFAGCSDPPGTVTAKPIPVIMTSDTILSGMVAALLPPDRYSVEAILPPGHCPGHYDVKPSDMEKMKRAVLVVSFKGISFMSKTGGGNGGQISVDTKGRNWMAPDSYLHGLNIIAGHLSRCFPEDREIIMDRCREAVAEIGKKSNELIALVRDAGLQGKPVITSSMQKEALQWMGLAVVGEYGRSESMSAKEFLRLVEIGKRQGIVAVVDNLQSGPDSGRGIAETLRIPHVVLTNFPAEEGYLAAVRDNVNAVVKAVAPQEKDSPR